MKPKLTMAQRLLLIDLEKTPEAVSESYAPGKRLVELGYATSRESAFGTLLLEITDAGRAALAELKP